MGAIRVKKVYLLKFGKQFECRHYYIIYMILLASIDENVQIDPTYTLCL